VGRRHSSEEREDRRERFLDAAITVVRRDGHAASMEAMAREAGVTKPILYRMFGDRNGLLEAIGDRFAQELAEVLAQALAGAPGSGAPSSDRRDILRSTIDAYLGLVDRDPELYRFLTAQLATAPSQPIATLADQFARGIAVVLSEQLRAINADSDAAEPWAYALVGMVHLAGDWWVTRRTITREALVDYLVVLVWDGLAALAP
jgi:AcrR family transcriptional regulator